MYKNCKPFLKKIPFHPFKNPYYTQTIPKNFRINGIDYTKNNYIYHFTFQSKTKTIQPVKSKILHYDENIAAQIGFIP